MNPTVDTSLTQGDALKAFQLTKDVKSKSDFEFGKRVAQYIDRSSVGGNAASYFFTRNVRYKKNRDLARGTYNAFAAFADRLEMNGKSNYANISWKSLMIVNRIISKMVGSWMKRNERIKVTTIDSFSEQQKKDQADEAEFVLNHKEQLAQLQNESGVPMVKPDQFIAEDKDELDAWVLEFNNLPEEIKYELGVNNILTLNSWFDVLKEKVLHDSAEVGFIGTYTDMNEDGEIVVKWVKPENAIYSYSDYEDLRDTTWRGEIVSLKISELRKKYGVENGGKLTEDQLWEIAQQSKDYQLYDKMTWNTEWTVAFLRPYDEWNLDAIKFQLKTVDEDGYSIKTTGNGSTIVEKTTKKVKPSENKKVVSKDKWNIYNGVFLRTPQILLEWGLKKNMVRPQDPTEIGEAEFSYSFYMYQNRYMRNIAVPEKIERPYEDLMIILLKMQQVVARMRPTGAAINWDALQEIDFGLGDEKNKEINPKKLYDQTGDIYYRGKDAEGNPISVPIVELQNSGFLGQMKGLIEMYQFQWQVLKDQLGEDPNLNQSALQPRTTSSNVQASISQSDDAIDYMYKAYLRCMEDTAKKISCLLYDSVRTQAKAYRHILKQDDISGRIFSTKIEMLPDDMEIAKLESMLNAAIQSNPEFILYCDPFRIMRIAKEDIKLAELLFRQSQKRALKSQMEQAQHQSEMNAQVQVQSAQSKQQGDAQLLQMESEIDMQKEALISANKSRDTALTGFFELLKAGIPIPPQLQPVANAVFENVLLPAVVANEQQRSEIQQQMMAAQQQQEQPPQQMGQQAPPDQMQGQQPAPDQQQQPTQPQDLQAA